MKKSMKLCLSITLVLMLLMNIASASSLEPPALCIFTVREQFSDIDSCKHKFSDSFLKFDPQAKTQFGANDLQMIYGSYKIYVVCDKDLAIISVAGPSYSTAEKYSHLINSYSNSTVYREGHKAGKYKGE